jgi:hypothetical protein
VDDELPADVSTGTDRRTALKKAAIAAGVVAWTTPAVQAVTARPAHAQQVTNCVPVLTAKAQLTGAGCKCTPSAPPQCCDDNTFFIQVFASCGAGCPGTPAIVVSSITGAGLKPGCPIEAFQRLNCLGSPPTAQVQIKATVTCPNGKITVGNQTVTVGCTPCAAALTATTDSNLFEEPSLDAPPETTRTETTIGGGDPPAAESPPADESPPAGQSPPADSSPPGSAGGGDGGG